MWKRLVKKDLASWQGARRRGQEGLSMELKIKKSCVGGRRCLAFAARLIWLKLQFRPNPPRAISGLVAQLVEQCPFKALVQGSSPCQPTTVFEAA
ncbi:MAG: hypothetical protein JWR26_2009 [Pedosphaera sp.]|nr:hypothetical protein [Pedosphaera sp.]